ncbi:hypothetical protein HI914_04455 [Erysiphe necator]|nr:hypothetical protein HI914_04455 [Erysiphe necator]
MINLLRRRNLSLLFVTDEDDWGQLLVYYSRGVAKTLASYIGVYPPSSRGLLQSIALMIRFMRQHTDSIELCLKRNQISPMLFQGYLIFTSGTNSRHFCVR